MGVHPIFQLVYVSSAIDVFSDAQLLDLLDVSRRNNLAGGITGMLLYKDGNFMQLLEGDEAAVRDTFGRIRNDPRHRDIITLLQAPAAQRDFADWTMGFRNLATIDADRVPGYTEFLDLPLDADDFAAEPSRCQRLLRTFKRSMR